MHKITQSWDFPGGLRIKQLKLQAPSAVGPGSIPGQGTRAHMLQLKIQHSATKIPNAVIKIECSKKKKKRLKSHHVYPIKGSYHALDRSTLCVSFGNNDKS